MIRGIDLEEKTQPEIVGNAENNFRKRYNHLSTRKSNKLSLMRKVQKYLAPKDDHLVRNGDLESDLFDVRGARKLKRKSIASISGIINAFSDWVILAIEDEEDEEERQAIKEWSKATTKVFGAFIAKSGYYEHGRIDKFNYDVYGFSCMTFGYDEEEKTPFCQEQNVFSVVASTNSRGTLQESYHVKEFSIDEAKKVIGFVPENIGAFSTKVRVLVALTPNKTDYITAEEGKKLPWVQSYYLISEGTSNETGAVEGEGQRASFWKEIGQRRYFNFCPQVLTKDSYSSEDSYGEGEGRLLLPSSMNLNTYKRDLVITSNFISRPPMQVPDELADEFKTISPGEILPIPPFGQEIKVLDAVRNPQQQLAILQFEAFDFDEQTPSAEGNSPFAKKARQSQYEVSEGIKEQRQEKLAHISGYLMKGVVKHLQILFEICLENKLITLPDGVSKERVRPSLDSLLAKEYSKEKAQSFVEALGYMQGVMQLAPEVTDNLKADRIFRNTFIDLGVGEALEEEDTVTDVREARQKQQADQTSNDEALNQEIAGSEINKNNADASLKRATAGGVI